MTRIRSKAFWTTTIGLLLICAMASVGCQGCKTGQEVEPLPPVVEAEVEAEPAVEEKIDFINVSPWTVKQGETITVSTKATPGRTVVAKIIGSNGQEYDLPLRDDGSGNYSGSWTVPDDIPPGSYSVEVTMTGTADGEPVVLRSSRSITINPKDIPDPLAELRGMVSGMTVLFDFDSSDIRADARASLDRLASAMRPVAGDIGELTVEGHCDERGSIEYNLSLGQRRARAVRDYLVNKPGLSGVNIGLISKGEEEPAVPNARTEDQHQQNRRAEFSVR